MIETERLLLRRFRPGDAAALHGYLSDSRVVRYEPYDVMDEERSAREALRRIEDPAFLAVCLRMDGRMIGNIYLRREDHDAYTLGYVFAHAHWGHGYATEAARAAMGHAFAEGAHRVYAMCNPENVGSWRVMEHLGMRREAHFRRNVYFRADPTPQWQDTYVYAILRDEWEGVPC